MNNWNDYKNWIASTVKSGSKFYFRGQEDPNWKLQSSFHRLSDKVNISLEQYLTDVIPEVRHNVCSTQNEKIPIDSPLQIGEFLSRIQHHGFPTPLLDWTMSPFVAAFFALKNINPHNTKVKEVVIYIFDYELWSSKFGKELIFNNINPFVTPFRPIAHNNPRMVRQMAVTTVTNVPDLGEYLINIGAGQPMPYLYKVTLPIYERRQIMNELNLMGINSMSMFPDLDGVCASMKETFFNNIDAGSLAPLPPSLATILTGGSSK